MTQPERRRSPRALERVPLQVVDGGLELEGETRNLSAAGLYCTLDRFIPPMSKLTIHLQLPGRLRQRRIRCIGVVVRVEPGAADAQRMRYHTALFFTEIADRDREAISHFVQRRLDAAERETRARA